MQSGWLAFALLFVSSIPGPFQTLAQELAGNNSDKTARELLSKVRESLGGKDRIKFVRSLPFQIVKAVNGAPVQEWKIGKYKINPDLKAKRFEKK